ARACCGPRWVGEGGGATWRPATPSARCVITARTSPPSPPASSVCAAAPRRRWTGARRARRLARRDVVSILTVNILTTIAPPDIHPAARNQGAGGDHTRPGGRPRRAGDADAPRARGAAARQPAGAPARGPRHRGTARVEHRAHRAPAPGVQAAVGGEADRRGAL